MPDEERSRRARDDRAEDSHPAPIAGALGMTIRLLRTERDMKRTELAERSGVSYSYLSDIEHGRKPPSSRILRQIADALDLPGHELLRRAEDRLAHEEGQTDEWDLRADLMEAEEISPTLRALWEEGRVNRSAALDRGHSDAGRSELFPAEEPDWVRNRRGASAAPDASPSSARHARILEELSSLLPRMRPADAERILDMARRLAE